MVDVIVESLASEGLTNEDTFVAVRVGDHQKLTRLAAERAYSFQESAVGHRKYGKLDVFKRVGSANISIKPEAPRMQDIRAELSDDGSLMQFRASVSEHASANKRLQQAQKIADTESNPRILEAKRYLLEHNLENRLAEATQAVLRDRPADPAQFIADFLRSTKDEYQKLAAFDSPGQTAALGAAPQDATSRAAADAARPLASELSALKREAAETLEKACKDGILEDKLKEAMAQCPA